MPLTGYRKPFTKVLLSKILLGDDCWEWTGARDLHGYGVLNREHKMKRAHRVVYEWLVGPIPEGLVIDHLCRNRSCVNPAHLEPVTEEENFARAPKPYDALHERSHCKHGHEFTAENTIVRDTGWPRCRQCGNAAARRYQSRMRASG